MSDRSKLRVESTTITPKGRLIRGNLRTLFMALLAIAVFGWALTQFGRNQIETGPNSSMFVTDVNGTAALAELLTELDFRVGPAVTPLEDLDQVMTLLILDPQIRATYEDVELEAITEWVENGGRLIVSGRPHPDLVGPILPDDLRLGLSGQSPADIVMPIRGAEGSLESSGLYSIETEFDMTTLAGSPPIAAAFEFGDGLVVYVADSSIFWNPSLVDNGPWIISLIPEGPVLVDEVRHGFLVDPGAASPTGLLSAFPEEVRTVILLLLPVVGIALIVYARRFGPPEATERHLAPPRKELVDAVAGIMTRIPEPDTAEPVRARLRTVIARRAGLPAAASDSEVVTAGEALGLPSTELEAVLEVANENTMMEAQHMLALLSEKEGS